jgi:hypothetical protein
MIMDKHKFEPFQFDVNVCDTCGDVADAHPAPDLEYTPYREAIWKTLLKHGGIPDVYGGYRDLETMMVRAHLGMAYEMNTWHAEARQQVKKARSNCKIDFKRTADPIMDQCSVFGGTFTETDYFTPAVTGTLYCVCGEIRWQQIALKDKTLGQLIWLTIKEGEISG